mgnify:CR=1 FL=1
MAGSAEIVVAHGLWQMILHSFSYVPIQICVIGASQTGKTTIDKQLVTRGEIRPLSDADRTHHRKSWLGNYKLPTATKKKIRSEGLARTIVSRDLGGHIEYHSTWLRDMIERKVNTVIIVIDNRHLENERNIDNQTALGYLVEGLAKRTVPKGLSWRARLRARKYAPKRVILLANKADEWMSDEDYALWDRGFVSRHRIFDVFREDLYRLQAMHVPVYIDATSAKYGWNLEKGIMEGMKI